MKRTKRISIEIWHREVSIAVAGSTFHVPDIELDAANPGSVCPTCGSPWITLQVQADGNVSVSPDRILQALQRTDLHLQIAPSGQLRICQRSFEEIKETF